jgi:hypothetical protein
MHTKVESDNFNNETAMADLRISSSKQFPELPELQELQFHF